MRKSFEWLVAWRYLRDREKANWSVFAVGLVFLFVGIGFALLTKWLPGLNEAPELVAGGLHLSQLTFYFGVGFLGLGVMVTLFGSCLAVFNLFTTISVFGVFLGVTALIVVLSVMSGFESDLRNKILGNNAHIRIKAGTDDLVSEERLIDLLGQRSQAADLSPSEKGRGDGDVRGEEPPKERATNVEGVKDDGKERGEGKRGRKEKGEGKNGWEDEEEREEKGGGKSYIVGDEATTAEGKRRKLSYQKLDQSIKQIEGLVAVSPYLQAEVVLTGPKTHMGVYLKGVVPHRADKVSDLGKNIIEGVLSNLEFPGRLRFLYHMPEPVETIEFDVSSPESGTFNKKLLEPKIATGDDEEPFRTDDKVKSRESLDSRWQREIMKAGVASEKEKSGMNNKPLVDDDDERLKVDTHPEVQRPDDDSFAPWGELGKSKNGSSDTAAGDVREKDELHNLDLKQLEAARAFLEKKLKEEKDREQGDDLSVLLGKDFEQPSAERSPPSFDFSDTPVMPSTEKILPGIVIGKELAKTVGLRLGDTVDVVSADAGGMGPLGPVPRIRAFRVAGVFFSGHYEFDTKYAYVRMTDAQDFLKQKGKLTGVEIRVTDTKEVSKVATVLKKLVSSEGAVDEGDELIVQSWQQIHKNLFSALKLEKIVMFLVLAIIVLVASFSIGCNLIMMVRKKRGEIAALKSLGADNPSIYRIFVIEGLYIGFLGMFLGLGLGMGVCLFLKHFGLRLDPEIYYISKLPVQINPLDIFAICLACVGISFAATLYPAWQAAQLHPVEAFRTE